MCGFSAVVSLSTKPLDPSFSAGSDGEATSRVERSLEAIAHRGPDARAQWTSEDGRVALGHVRLAINDLSPDGEQPFHSWNGHVHAVVNGELYDADNIRQKLAKETGAVFKGRSDCEIVLALYEQHGTGFLQHLRGEFALCLYDARKRLFMAARDRYGIKPLFFTEVDGNLLVAAEAKALVPLGWRPEWDVKSIMERGVVFDTRTSFKGVQNIKPGYYFTSDASGFVDHHCYWDLQYPDKHIVDKRSEDDLVTGVRERLLEAVRLRLEADVPVGIYLSGGIDSSAIAGMVTHLIKEQGAKSGTVKHSENIHCYSIQFDRGSDYDESDIAKRTAEWLGVQFHRAKVDEQVLADNFEEATWHCEHTVPDLNYIGKFVLSKLPREHGVKVVLTGEGADEHFAGYSIFKPDSLAEPDYSRPDNALSDDERLSLLTEVKKTATSIYQNTKQDATEDVSVQQKFSRQQLNGVNTLAAVAQGPYKHFSPWTSAYGDMDYEGTIIRSHNGLVRNLMQNSWHPLHTGEYIWVKGNLPNSILTSLGDRCEMAHSLEARTPFLDHHLTEYANKLPPSVKMRWDASTRQCKEKWVLREAVKPFITQELYERQKRQYLAPPSWPVGGPIHKLLSRLITEQNVRAVGFVDWDLVKDYVPKAFEQGDSASFRKALTVAQLVVLSRKFGVKQAGPQV